MVGRRWAPWVLGWCVAVAPAAAASADLARAQALVDQGRATEALAILDGLLAKDARDPEAFLLRSTAHFQIGEIAAGTADLDRALTLAPDFRQAWLNRAAVAIADARYDDALAALERARTLDPDAADNLLNLGAVKLLLGRLDEATADFRGYLSRNPTNAEAFYLVATNYAMTGYAGLAIQNLQQAITVDERVRRRARLDPNFSDLAAHPRFQDLMSTDLWKPPAGARQAQRVFAGRYAGGNGPLLPATLDALQLLGEPLEPQGEVTPEWALLWGDVRVKVLDRGGQGIVELTAPASRFSDQEWTVRAKRILDSIAVQLARKAG